MAPRLLWPVPSQPAIPRDAGLPKPEPCVTASEAVHPSQATSVYGDRRTVTLIANKDVRRVMLLFDLEKHRNDDAVEHADCRHGKLRVVVEAMLYCCFSASYASKLSLPKESSGRTGFRERYRCHPASKRYQKRRRLA